MIRNDLQEMSFELAEIIRDKIRNMERENRDTINYILDQTDKKIERDREDVKRNMIQRAEYRLNQQVSKRIKEINSNIVKTKLNYVEKLIGDFKQEIQRYIENNMHTYFEFLHKKFLEFSHLFEDKVFLVLNERDRKHLESNQEDFPVEEGVFDISNKTINTIGGFFVKQKENEFTIDFTFETVIEDKRSLIYKKLMNIFPVFEVNTENAIEIYEKKHAKDNN